MHISTFKYLVWLLLQNLKLGLAIFLFSESGSAICTFHLRSICDIGNTCPFRHVRADRSVVCKHWLRGLCKKGDDCEFLHEYDMSKMPECYFFQKFGKSSTSKYRSFHANTLYAVINQKRSNNVNFACWEITLNVKLSEFQQILCS